MKNVPEKYFFEMFDSCRFVLEMKAERTLEDYKRDRLFRSAVEQELTIIGRGMARLKAANLASPSLFTDRDTIIELREHLIHRYFDIDAIGVWHFLTEKLPILRSELEKTLNAASKTTDGVS